MLTNSAATSEATFPLHVPPEQVFYKRVAWINRVEAQQAPQLQDGYIRVEGCLWPVLANGLPGCPGPTSPMCAATAGLLPNPFPG